MVLAISSDQVINGYFPRANEVITNFIDALVSLKLDPEAKFSKKLNKLMIPSDVEFVDSPSSDYLVYGKYAKDSLKLLENAGLLKFITYSNLINLSRQLGLFNPESNNNQNHSTLINAITPNVKAELESYSCGKGSPLDDIYSPRQELPTKEKTLTQDQITSNLPEEQLRKEANELEENFDSFIDAVDKWNLKSSSSKELNTTIDKIVNNKNIIPAFKILNLRPLVKDLNGFMNLSGDKDMTQFATALNQELAAKAPSDQLDNYKKLALAVFPEDIAGRLRAAGFAPTNSKA